ncbi:MAG: NAD(P)-dependent alcohol dehydrogenase [Anaerolineaceae bacterium]|nr:NAD(P)-dependent alcohol dehydrogenase [Anaerolineaceae bacterium]
MKAMIFEKYGNPSEVLHMAELDKPELQVDEVLVKVIASSITFSDAAMVYGKPFLIRFATGGLLKPKQKLMGKDISGVVEAVGSQVTKFKVGDEVFADLFECGLKGYAEYVAVPEKWLVQRPSNISFEEAAAAPESAVVALQGLRDLGKIQAGQDVLVVGASGGIGTYAVQIAKAYGAHVTGVCSTRNVELVRSLGVDEVIDYTTTDFTAGKKKVDLILATAGYRKLADYQKALKPTGIHVVTGGKMSQLFEAMLLGAMRTRGTQQKMTSLSMHPNPDDLRQIKEWFEMGKIKSVIDSVYPLSGLGEAMEYYAGRHARGKVVVRIAQV